MVHRMSRTDDGTHDADAFFNWCHTHKLVDSNRVRRPENQLDITDAIAESRNRKLQIKVLGNGFSWPYLLSNDESLGLRMDSYLGDVETHHDSVDVPAGTTLAHLSRTLSRDGLRLDCSPPVIAQQTVAGAIATGTHGQGLSQSTIGDTLESVNYIDSHGVGKTIAHAHPHFGAFRAHLGSLGVVTSLRLRTVRNTLYTCEKRAVSYQTFLRHFEDWNEEYEYAKAWWFPEHDLVHLWLVREASLREKRAFNRGGRPLLTWGEPRNQMNLAVDWAVERMKLETLSFDLKDSQFRTVNRFRDFQDVTGDINDILCKGIPVPQINCEIGVPLENFQEAQDRLYSWNRRYRPSLHYPIILRATGASQAWLSPAYEQTTCHYGFVVYQGRNGTFKTSSFDQLNTVQRELYEVGGLPHLGKYYDRNLYNRTEVGRWTQFDAIKNIYDPDQIFASGL